MVQLGPQPTCGSRSDLGHLVYFAAAHFNPFPPARYHHNDWPQRVQNLDRTGMRGEHVGHRAIGVIEVGTDQHHSTAASPGIRLGPPQLPLGILAIEQPPGAVRRRVKRSRRLGALDAFQISASFPMELTTPRWPGNAGVAPRGSTHRSRAPWRSRDAQLIAPLWGMSSVGSGYDHNEFTQTPVKRRSCAHACIQ